MANILLSNNNVNLTQQMIRPNANLGGSIDLSNRYDVYGTLMYSTASSAQTITLPDPSVASFVYQDFFVDYVCANTSNALTTFSVTGGSIQGQSSIVMGAKDNCRFITDDGVNYSIQSLFLQPANFRAYLSANATLPASPSTLTILFDTEVRDVGAFYNPATGIWTPLLPGIGLCGGQVMIDFDGSESTVITLQLQKNGTAISTDIQQGTVAIARKIRLFVYDGDVNFNGSSDNYKLVISQTGANTQTILGTIDQTFFYGKRDGAF